MAENSATFCSSVSDYESYDLEQLHYEYGSQDELDYSDEQNSARDSGDEVDGTSALKKARVEQSVTVVPRVYFKLSHILARVLAS